MRIWMLKPDVARYDSFLLPKEFDPEYIRAFDGRTQMSNWKPVRVQRSYHDENLELSDYPNFCFPICSEKAVYLLKPLIGSDVEFLPVEYCEGKYCVINILTVINAVDRSKSAYRTFRDGKRIMAFMKYAFFPEVVANVPVFKITEERTRYPFVSDAFKRVVEDDCLTGFEFTLVWDSENG